MTTPLLIYVAGKYTGSTREEIQANIDTAEEYGKKILLRGHIPCIPHRITAHWDICPQFTDWKHSDWLNKFCLPLLSRCDGILILPGWDLSLGAAMELDHAETLGLKTFYSVEELP